MTTVTNTNNFHFFTERTKQYHQTAKQNRNNIRRNILIKTKQKTLSSEFYQDNTPFRTGTSTMNRIRTTSRVSVFLKAFRLFVICKEAEIEKKLCGNEKQIELRRFKTEVVVVRPSRGSEKPGAFQTAVTYRFKSICQSIDNWVKFHWSDRDVLTIL